eukprot:TRINITY_DN12535_c1_g2_i12.p2 TRINITY_DN12535_c1_g2~~TRINITY_DN12535_c1_g2_i12.p2  ORF type:complete len:132 (-),score=19.37 TRINITY_DN12535_c1_g2_i12:737-1132(-)
MDTYHGSMQSLWYSCLQGKVRISSSTSNCPKQMMQIGVSSSNTITLDNELQLFVKSLYCVLASSSVQSDGWVSHSNSFSPSGSLAAVAVAQAAAEGCVGCLLPALVVAQAVEGCIGCHLPALAAVAVALAA